MSMAPAECCALCFSSEQIPSAPIAPNFRIFQNSDSFRASIQTIFRTSLTRLRHQHFPSASMYPFYVASHVSLYRTYYYIQTHYTSLPSQSTQPHVSHHASLTTMCTLSTHISAFTPHRWHYIGTTHHTHASVHTQLFYVQKVCTHHFTHTTYNFIPHTIHIYMHAPHRYYQRDAPHMHCCTCVTPPCQGLH